MEPRLPDNLMAVFILIIFVSTGSVVNYEDLHFCGTWRHGNGPLNLNITLSPGCDRILISANSSSLSIDGQITALCSQSKVIPLNHSGLGSEPESNFCLYWEPLLDRLKLQFRGKDLTLCPAAKQHISCCADLSNGRRGLNAQYGIINGTVRTDVISNNIHSDYIFNGTHIACKTLNDEIGEIGSSPSTTLNSISSIDNGGMDGLNDEEHQGSTPAFVTEDTAMGSSVEVEMKKDFKGFNHTWPDTSGVSAKSRITVMIPPALKDAAKSTSKVVCTFIKNKTMFQEGPVEITILNVVEITVGNDIIKDLCKPITIDFHHDIITKRHSRKCVSWDTLKDPGKVNWVVDGCETRQYGENHTECRCNHLTYFTVLVQLEPRPVRHLLALTTITYLGCAVSVISCIALIIYLCRRSRHCKEQSIHIHLGLAVSLALLNLLFFFTGVLANVGGESVCTLAGAALHYTLLSSFSWMSIQVFHTFWLVYMVFSPLPKPYVWNLVGFALPALPVVILAAVGDIYGFREVAQVEDESDPYKMCWMKGTHKALLAHYFTNMTILAILVMSGIVMLFLVYRKIRARDEWRQNRVAFLSIWGLSCLFGITWGLTFLDFGPLSDFVLFFSCILNSFQGFLLMLRFYMLDWMRKQAGGSGLGSTSSGSTRHHMLQTQEKS
uniref:adhesion G-protein coupled receptor G1 n=1 Tax=Semicossyphus pulcher TaxID=241346 RepID=UPI0037E7E891